MCVKLHPEDLNPGPYHPHPTSIYTCGVTTTPRVRGGDKIGTFAIYIYLLFRGKI